MAHLRRKKTLLRELQQRLDKNPVGTPAHEAFTELLALLFTKEEAWLGSRFPLRPSTLEAVAAAVGKRPDAIGVTLESLCQKGLVRDLKVGGRTVYGLSMAFVGFFELTLMRQDLGVPREMVADLMFRYRQTAAFIQEVFGSATPRGRVLPLERAVRSEVLSYELASQAIERAELGCLGPCYCREEAHLVGQGCSAPRENICISLDMAAEYLIRRGFKRQASRHELLGALDRAAQAGLVHVADNVQSSIAFICNCCGCCCGLLAGASKHGLPASILPAGFWPRMDEANCDGCGACAQACPVGALATHTEGMPGLDRSRCLGCGLCVLKCSSNALALERRPTPPLPPEDHHDLMRRLIAEKGREEYYERV